MSPTSPAWAGIRKQFPILDQTVNGHPLVYLDNAATTQKPLAVIEAVDRFYRKDNANVHRGLHALSMRATEDYEGARMRVARFVNAAAPEEIIFTRGTTESINLVAQSWAPANLKKGDVILLTEMEHHSNIVPWQLAAQRTGATLRYVPVTGDEGHLDLAALDRLLTPEVKVFAFTHVSNTLGTVNPAAELGARAQGRRDLRRRRGPVGGALCPWTSARWDATSWHSPVTRWRPSQASACSRQACASTQCRRGRAAAA